MMEKKVNGIEYTMTAAKANIMVLFFVFPILLISVLPYFAIWGVSEIMHTNLGEVVFIAALLAGIVVHELIHGLCWGVFAQAGFKSIKFGIIWQALTPYCHCKEVLTVSQYRIGALMPTIILGILPVIFSWITGNYLLLMFGIFLTVGGSGDLLVVWMTRKLNKTKKIKDHPFKVGFYIPGE